MFKVLFTYFLLLFTGVCYAQTGWELAKDKNGIKVYLSKGPGSDIKNVKVVATMQGSYEKLITILSNVDGYKSWVYHNKSGHMVKKVSPTEMIAYTETFLPWPALNRDAVVHMKIDRDRDNKYLKILVVGIPNFLPEKKGKVRVPSSTTSWHVTMTAPNMLSITCLIEANPGGSVPGWIVNKFVDKGPLETFLKLKELLKGT